jgi:hypothetical protein
MENISQKKQAGDGRGNNECIQNGGIKISIKMWLFIYLRIFIFLRGWVRLGDTMLGSYVSWGYTGLCYVRLA